MPLIIMASVFVLPTYRSCSDEPLLALLTLRALRRREVDLTTRRLGLGAIGGLALCTAATNSLILWPLEGVEVVALSVMTAVLGGAVLLIRRARGKPGWRIWEHLLAAFALVVSVSGPAVFLGQEVFFGSGKYLGPGAYLEVGAVIGLLLVTLSAVVTRRLSPGSPEVAIEVTGLLRAWTHEDHPSGRAVRAAPR